MFGEEVESFALQFSDANEKTVRGTTIKLTESFIDSSPVDQGRFRANWLVTFGGTNKFTKSKDKGGEKTKAKLRGKILSQKRWDKFTITNNLPYALVIEYGGYPSPVKKGTYLGKGKGYEIRSRGGFSKQAAQGVMRMNVKLFNRLIEQEAKRNMPK